MALVIPQCPGNVQRGPPCSHVLEKPQLTCRAHPSLWHPTHRPGGKADSEGPVSRSRRPAPLHLGGGAPASCEEYQL